MSDSTLLFLAIAIPIGVSAAFALGFFLLGRRMRRLRRAGRITHRAKTTPGSNDFSGSTM
ncbi:hypothetical protein ACWEKT_16520 [Nocardia takedensis]